MRALGRNGPDISVIGYGAWEAGGKGWGPNPPDDQVEEAVRAGLDAGITWLDTAEIYGAGRSEELMGRALRHRPDVLVFTKVASAPRGTGYRPENVRAAAERSLRRLGRDVIDLYQLHWQDESEVALEETWGAMVDLVHVGLARWIGVSNFDAHALLRCERIRHVDSVQPQLSMLWQERMPLLEVCRTNGSGVIAYGPLAYGLLTGSITAETSFPPDDWRSGGHGLRAYDQLFRPGRLERNLSVVQALRPSRGPTGHLPQSAVPGLAAASWRGHRGDCRLTVTAARQGERRRLRTSTLSPGDLADDRFDPAATRRGRRRARTRRHEASMIVRQGERDTSKLTWLRVRGRGLRTARAYRWRLAFDAFFDQPPALAGDYIDRWYRGAIRSRLEPIKDLAYTVGEHWDGVRRWHTTRISNGVLEGINSLVQAAKRRARGYRTRKNLIVMTYLIAGKLDMASAHTK